MDDKSLSVNDPNREGMLVTYALPRYGFSLMLTCADFIVLFLYTEVYALSGLLAGVAAGMGKVAIALSTFLGGYLSDRTQTRWGKRRPFLLLGSPILMITFIFLLIPTFIIGYQTPEIIVFLWYLLFNCLFQAFYGILWAAYHALMPAFAKVHERPKTSMWQNIFNYLATGTGVIYTFLGVTVFTNRYEETGVLEPEFAWVFIGFGSVIVILLYLMHFRIPLAEDEFEKSGGNFVEEMHVIRENKNYLWLIVFHGVTGLTTAMQTVLLLGFSEKVLKLEGIRLYTIAVLLILGILFFVGIWRKLIEVKGKKTVLKYILLFQIAFLPLSLVGLYQGDMFFFAMFFVLGLTCLAMRPKLNEITSYIIVIRNNYNKVYWKTWISFQNIGDYS